MKIILKFKDGVTVTNNFTGDDPETSGQGDLLELLAKGKRENGDISVTDSSTGEVSERKYNDLYSLEIVMSD